MPIYGYARVSTDGQTLDAQIAGALVEIKGETVLEVPEGWRLWDGRIVSRDRAKLSPDGKFHLCETLSKSILCFFVPPGSS